jgi:hypothetical protein
VLKFGVDVIEAVRLTFTSTALSLSVLLAGDLLARRLERRFAGD